MAADDEPDGFPYADHLEAYARVVHGYVDDLTGDGLDRADITATVEQDVPTVLGAYNTGVNSVATYEMANRFIAGHTPYRESLQGLHERVERSVAKATDGLNRKAFGDNGHTVELDAADYEELLAAYTMETVLERAVANGEGRDARFAEDEVTRVLLSAD